MANGNGNGLSEVQHIVVLMLENRSFDHMLGYLYSAEGNVTPAGQAFEGLTGSESNPDANGNPVTVFKIEPTTPNAYYMPGGDPGEGYMATNSQLFGRNTAAAGPAAPPMQGFVKDFAYTLGWQSREHGWKILPGTTASDIMGCYTPEALPVLSALAKGYAICDRWFSSAPTETLPNRAFAAGGNQPGAPGRQDQDVHLAEHFRPARPAQHHLGHLRIPGRAAHQVNLHRHRVGTGWHDRQVCRLRGGGSRRVPASFLLPRAFLVLDRKQSASGLRCGPRRAVDARGLRGRTRRTRVAADAADHHLRRARWPV